MTQLIQYSHDIEAGNLEEIKKHVARFAWLLPDWLRILYVNVENTDNQDSLSCITVNEPYRHASMNLRPRWFTEREEMKAQAIAHELIHLHTNPLYDFACNAIRKLSSDENTRQLVLDEMECYVERSTEDLSHAVLKVVATS